MKKWIINAWVDRPPDEKIREVDYTCIACKKESKLTVMGIPEAQIDSGIVFDPITPRSIPTEVTCPYCGAKYSYETTH